MFCVCVCVPKHESGCVCECVLQPKANICVLRGGGGEFSSTEPICFSSFHTHSWGISAFSEKKKKKKKNQSEKEERERDKKKESVLFPAETSDQRAGLFHNQPRLAGLISETSQSLPLARISLAFPRCVNLRGERCLTLAHTRAFKTDRTQDEVWAT